MSSIIFEGNTYIFGATISANPGTGTTSYVFGGLSSGWTYGFIIWAFNGVGPSSIVGPLTKVTLSEIPEENRPMIGAMAWNWAHAPISESTLTLSGSTVNIIPASAEPNNDVFWDWTSTPFYNFTTGYTAPDGSTTAWRLQIGGSTAPAITFNLNLASRPSIQGGTYIYSIYQNVSLGVTAIRPIFYVLDQTNTARGPTYQQLLPTLGTIANNNLISMNSVGATVGWNRFAASLYFAPSLILGSDGTQPLYHTFMSLSSSAGQTREVYFWGMQLEKVQ